MRFALALLLAIGIGMHVACRVESHAARLPSPAVDSWRRTQAGWVHARDLFATAPHAPRDAPHPVVVTALVILGSMLALAAGMKSNEPSRTRIACLKSSKLP